MWNNISKYLVNKKVLEIGCGIGQKTNMICNYTNKVTAIDISQESINIAKKNFDNKKVSFLVMDASNLKFNDKSFDVVITTDSFHEIDPLIQNNVLEEMTRMADTIIFIEPNEISVTNELFKVFDPNENHSLRIKNSMEKAFKHMKNHNYKQIENGYYNDISKFDSEEEMYNTLLDWWNDIKVPKDEYEKNQMIGQIKTVLQNFNMLENMEVFERINYYVFVKEK